MTPEENVVALHRQQLVLEGFPEAKGNYFSLQSVKNLPTDKRLRWQQHVTGTFEGTVSSYQMVDRKGDPVQVFTIAVNEATLDG